jgi:hypothetical protein
MQLTDHELIDKLRGTAWYQHEVGYEEDSRVCALSAIRLEQLSAEVAELRAKLAEVDNNACTCEDVSTGCKGGGK